MISSSLSSYTKSIRVQKRQSQNQNLQQTTVSSCPYSQTVVVVEQTFQQQGRYHHRHPLVRQDHLLLRFDAFDPDDHDQFLERFVHILNLIHLRFLHHHCLKVLNCWGLLQGALCLHKCQRYVCVSFRDITPCKRSSRLSVAAARSSLAFLLRIFVNSDLNSNLQPTPYLPAFFLNVLPSAPFSIVVSRAFPCPALLKAVLDVTRDPALRCFVV